MYNNPITHISFEIGNKINICYDNLLKRGFDYVEGDIRNGSGKKFVAIGYKRLSNCYPITNIIGLLSKNREPQSIIEKGIQYDMILDGKGNGDIHKGSGGSDLYLYYTNNINAGSPIREIIFSSYPQKKTSKIEAVQNCSKSRRQGDLDINAERGKTPFNYIIIIR